MSSSYHDDRSWGDEIFYKKGKEKIIKILTESQEFGEVIDYVPASEEDDNIFCIDTDINDKPCQVRLQRSSNKKNKDYKPTIRAGRPSGSETELRKFIKNYPRHIAGERCMPIYLIWILFDEEENEVISLEIINLISIFKDRNIRLSVDNSYRMKDDNDKYDYIENSDGTSFLVIKWGTVYSYP